MVTESHFRAAMASWSLPILGWAAAPTCPHHMQDNLMVDMDPLVVEDIAALGFDLI